jgi:hypothetical protein
MVETISSEDPQGGSPAPAGPPPARALPSGARATALTTAVSLVLVGGVVTAAVRGSGHSGSAETLAPASSFAFAQVDLGLADGQSSALSSFLAHFPDSPSRKGHGSLRDRLLAAMFRDSSHPHVDYAKDVKPWLGDRAAIAGWIDAQGRPEMEFLLRSTDDGKARASLHRLNPELGVVFSGGYAVIGQNQRLAQAAVTAAKKASLANDSHMHGDLARLNGPQVVTGWVDGARAGKALLARMHGKNPFAMMPGMLPGGMLPGLTSAQFKGRVVVGLHVTKTYAELVAETVDTGGTSSGLAPSAMLTRLPDATIGAAEIAAPGRLVSAAWGFVSAFFGLRSSFSSSATLGTMPGAYGSTHFICPAGAACTAPAIARPTIVPGKPLRTPTPAEQVQKATGLTMPGDAVTLLGSAAVVAYGGLHGQGLPNIALVTRPADLAAARALAEHSRDVIAQNTGVTAAVGTTGSDLVVATSAGYESTVETGGHLGTQSRFAAAMGTLPDQVAFAAYVDLADILPLFSHGKPDLEHLQALGLWVGRVGDGERFQARLVVS